MLLDDGADEVDAVVVAVPHESVAPLVPAAAVDAEALDGLGTSPIVNLHVHYDRRVLDEPLAAALDSPVQWIFDRTEASGAREGQLIAVSLSHAIEEIGASVADLRERYLPALERLLPAARGAEVLDFAVTHEPRATFRVAPGTRRLRPGPRTAVPGLFLAGRLDGHRLAADDGGRRPQRARRRPRRPRGARDRATQRARRCAPMTVTADRAVDAAQVALGRATDHLLALQHPDGWWKGELETNVTIDAEDIFLRHFLGLDDAETTRKTAAWIRAHQRPDGSWATYYGGPGDLSTTVEAYVALRIAGDPAGAEHMARAAAFVRESGGVEATRVFTRMWLSLLSLWSWAAVPTLPPEQILFPPWAPLSVYSFGCWARQTIVALSVVTALHPAVHVPFGIDELRPAFSRRPRRTTSGDAHSSSSTGPSTSTGATRSAGSGGGRCAPPSAGSSSARSATAPGAGSSRRGSGRSSRSGRSATSSTTR